METEVQQILESKKRQKVISWYQNQKSIAEIIKSLNLNLSQLPDTLQKKRFDFIYQKTGDL